MLTADAQTSDPVNMLGLTSTGTQSVTAFNIEAPPWFHFPDLHLKVDVLEDFEVVVAVYKHLYPTNPGFGLQQVIDFMQGRPDLAARNRDVPRRWKAFRQDNQ
jgi:spore coat polysaccharide biosynthesis protein SpsF (cytidylyltransferase family)